MGFFTKKSTSSGFERCKEKSTTRVQAEDNKTKIIAKPSKNANLSKDEARKNFGTLTKQSVVSTKNRSEDVLEKNTLSNETTFSVQSVKRSKRVHVPWSLLQQNTDKSLLRHDDFCLKPYKEQSGKYYFKCKMGERCKKSS